MSANDGLREPRQLPPGIDHFRTPRPGTIFHARTAPLNLLNAWGAWAGVTVVEAFRDVDIEYAAVRNAAALFDVSPLCKFRIAGPDAVAFLDRLTVRDVTRLAPGRVQYTLWCDDDGKVIDDGTLYRHADGTFWLCAQERHLEWLSDAAFGFDVTIADVSETIAGLALQGPTSFAVLAALDASELAALRPFDFAPVTAGALQGCLVSRTGFTGDLGYEIWLPEGSETAFALGIWDALVDAGWLHGLTPAGLQALRMARLEAGFIMAGRDFVPATLALRPTRRRSPYEVGLGRLVDLSKPRFNGRRALLLEEGGRRSDWSLVGLEVDGNVAADQALVFDDRGREVGHVTSAMWSPAAKRSIALASLKRPFGEGDDLRVEIYVQHELTWTRRLERTRVVPLPFYDPPRRRATPPGLR